MLRIQAEQKLIAKQQQILKDQPFVQDAEVILNIISCLDGLLFHMDFFIIDFYSETSRSILQPNT